MRQEDVTEPQGKRIVPFHCPMCGGELVYSDGSQDLICEHNGLDVWSSSVSTRMFVADPPRGDNCIFALSWTPSIHSGILWNVRIDPEETDYKKLAWLMREIPTRKYTELARNYQKTCHLKRRKKPDPEPYSAGDLSIRFGLAEEDVFSILHSSESVKELARYYGITKRTVEAIRESAILD